METVAGTALGIPAYMSPEQAAGRLEELGPASDVYSLGATLYAVLTGRAPVEGADPGAVLRQVQCGDFPPPRQVQAAVPPALNTVCQKAMARTAAGRYGTPLALAADVEHWLADEPVTAYPEPWPARLARRARRHRTLVFSAGAALAVLAVSLGVLAAVLTKHNHDLQVANARERQAREQARDAKAQARNNFRLARQAVKDYCVQISLDRRLQQSDLNVLRKQLLETAARFHEKFKEQEGEDPEVRAERAHAYFELGFIAQRTGSKEEAIGHYREALALLTGLVASHPDNREYRQYLASCYNSAASMYADTGRPKETEDAYLQSLALYQELVDTDRSDN
jgi:serine/threonine-protein kinase